MSHTEMTVTEAIESVTGFEEIAVRKHFDLDLYKDRETAPMTATRALVFVFKVREGMAPADAKRFVMGAPMRLVNNEFFAPEPEDIDPDDPDSESGKDDSSSE